MAYNKQEIAMAMAYAQSLFEALEASKVVPAELLAVELGVLAMASRSGVEPDAIRKQVTSAVEAALLSALIDQPAAGTG